jgi:hypothetical protein
MVDCTGSISPRMLVPRDARPRDEAGGLSRGVWSKSVHIRLDKP